MKIGQIGKRVFLLLAVNILVMVTITVILGVLRVGHYFPQGGLAGLAVVCLVWGFAGAFISLAISRLMAKWMMGVRVIPPDTSDPELRQLVDMVHGLARGAGLPLPEVGIYESDEVNAFATGPSRSRALVAVSSGLLRRMGSAEVEGVLGHEVTHIANGDMVTMTLIQGVINSFVLFLSRVLAFAISQALRSRDDREGGSYGVLQYLLVIVFQIVLSILGSLEGLENREKLCSTGLPGGLALLHTRNPDDYLFESGFIALGRTTQPIPFGAPDGRPTHLFFLLACPDSSFHLHTLARLCLMAQKTELLHNLLAASSRDEMFEILLNSEQAVLQEFHLAGS